MCFNPFYVYNPDTGTHFPSRCGRCYACMDYNRRQWKLRLQMEAKFADYSPLFITLTYDDDNLIKAQHDFGKRDFQNFMKRLRKMVGDYKIRYFAVNELGGCFGRLHWHLILFGFPLKYKNYFKRNDAFASIWKHGHVKVEDLIPQHIGYVCNYMYQERPKHDRKLCILSSRKPGIGCRYLTDDMINYLVEREDGMTLFNGTLTPLPRYLRKKVFTTTDELEILHEHLRKWASKDEYAILMETEDILYNEILAREKPININEYDATTFTDSSLYKEYITVLNNIILTRNTFLAQFSKKTKKAKIDTDYKRKRSKELGLKNPDLTTIDDKFQYCFPPFESFNLDVFFRELGTSLHDVHFGYVLKNIPVRFTIITPY